MNAIAKWEAISYKFFNFLDKHYGVGDNKERNNSIQKPENTVETDVKALNIGGKKPTQQPEKRAKAVINTFHWLGTENQLAFLYIELIKKRCISEDTPKDLFKRAFSNDATEPLKIKWIIFGKNKVTSKSSLFHFIELLISYKFLSMDEYDSSSMLYSKLINMFVDCNGNDLKNLKQSKAQRSQNPIEDERLRSIILSIPG